MADTPKRRPCRMQTVQTECSFLTLDSLFRLYSRAESHQSQTFQMFRGKLHIILSNFGRGLSSDNLTVCAPSHYSVLFTFDKSEMFTCRWTYWISVPTFLNCWLSSREILASHRSTRYFTWSSVHRSCVAVVLPFFLFCFLFSSVEVGVLLISLVGLLLPLPSWELPLLCPGWELPVVAWGIGVVEFRYGYDSYPGKAGTPRKELGWGVRPASQNP